MSNPQKSSALTTAAKSALKAKSMDAYSWMVIVVFAITFAVFIISLIVSISGKIHWDMFLELNGVTLSAVGALWTALGVRMSPREYAALMSIKKNSAVVGEEIIHSLQVASNFATFGGYCIFLGGSLLAIKVLMPLLERLLVG